MNDHFLVNKLNQRIADNTLRSLSLLPGKIDFCSNDYLGIATNDLIKISSNLKHGSGGSRLLSGNYKLIEEVEKSIAAFHEAEAGLIFNSGYDANLGLIGCVPQKSDLIIYDQLSHASIRDGIRVSFAQSNSFVHNDVKDLEKKLKAFVPTGNSNVFVITESVFSMDGDIAPLQQISELCENYNALLIVDEAHATGVIGDRGEGLVQKLNLQNKCFARIHTFGKGCGVHGAIIIGSETLKTYLLNFARSFVFTTALPEISISALQASYKLFPEMHTERTHLQMLVRQFQSATLKFPVLKSNTPIQLVMIPGNENVKEVARHLQEQQMDVRAILYPSVPKDQERLRIVLHSFNSPHELNRLIELLQ